MSQRPHKSNDGSWFRKPIDELQRKKEIEPALREALYGDKSKDSKKNDADHKAN